MSTITWLLGSGSWSTGAKWSTSAFPGPSDDAVIGVSESYTVAINVPAIDVALITASDNVAVLAIDQPGQTEMVTSTLNTSCITSAGSAMIANGPTLTITSNGGTFANSGSLSLAGNNTAPEGLAVSLLADANLTIPEEFGTTGTHDVDTCNFFDNSTLNICVTLNSGPRKSPRQSNCAASNPTSSNGSKLPRVATGARRMPLQMRMMRLATFSTLTDLKSEGKYHGHDFLGRR